MIAALKFVGTFQLIGGCLFSLWMLGQPEARNWTMLYTVPSTLAGGLLTIAAGIIVEQLEGMAKTMAAQLEETRFGVAKKG